MPTFKGTIEDFKKAFPNAQIDESGGTISYDGIGTSDRATIKEKPMAKAPKKSKYRAVKTTVHGITFASCKEATRYLQLKAMEKAGKIQYLTLQPDYALHCLGAFGVGLKEMCVYIADFCYYDCASKKTVIEDVKGMKTPMYRLKKKWCESEWGIRITEI